MKKILLLTDNDELLNRFRQLLASKQLEDYEFHYAYSPNNQFFCNKYKDQDWIKPLKVKESVAALVAQYDLLFSLHCKQIFPADLVQGIKCINIHPGLNPYNRGWFPQVFSIINGLPCGATIHEIDKDLDHGAIIAQKAIDIKPWDTSLSAYNKTLDVELELLDQYLVPILSDNYTTSIPAEGNVNLKKDFNALCEINLQDSDTFLNHINRLRALTHGEYMNAYFIDEEGNKVYLKLSLHKQ